MYSRQQRSFGCLPTLLILVGVVVAFGAYQVFNYLKSNTDQVLRPQPTQTAAAMAPTVAATATQLPIKYRVVAQKIGLSALITEVYLLPDADGWDLTYLDDFAGHLEGTPNFGQGGNYVLAGHVELGNGRPGPFINLEKLAVGDMILLYNDAPKDPVLIRYRVTEVRKVQPTDIDVIRNRGYEELTLLTCSDWDQGSETYATRVIVHAVPF